MSFSFRLTCLSVLALSCALPASSLAAAADPVAASAAASARFPAGGMIRLDVDATDVERGIFRAREVIPVEGAGLLRLRYPAWLPGAHAPVGAIANLTGLAFTADGRTLAWKRDPLDVYALLVEVPAGATELTADLVYLAPLKPEQGRVAVAPAMVSMGWHQVSLYPAGLPTRAIQVTPSVRLPDGWKQASALEAQDVASAEQMVRYRPVSYETLVDSPIIAGRNFRREDLGWGVTLNLIADQPENLVASEAQLKPHRALVTQAQKLFGVRHFDHYDFLVTMSDYLGGIGLEHHRSSENGVSPGYFTQWDEKATGRFLLPHEFVHSWNGKHRRGADVATPDFSTPMQNSLLWVYEGQTQFWGVILAARSGLASREDVLALLAANAATMEERAARQWRPLLDTTNDPIMASRRPAPWPSYQRSEDYYVEGMLLWLDADMTIREGTGGKKSLDDFARAFFGGRDGDWSVSPYSRADVVAALNAVYPYDWESFLAKRVDAVAPHAPLDWIGKGGYRLAYAAEPTAYFKATEKSRKIADFSYSLGLIVKPDGEITQVLWDSPAFAAKLVPGATILAINGRDYSAEGMKAALDKAAKDKRPIDLTLRHAGGVRMVAIDYQGGQRYPRLERVPGAPARLDALLAPKP